MSGPYDELYREVTRQMDEIIASDGFYADFIAALRTGRNSFQMVRKTLEKQIDEGWVSAIESALVPLDNAIRHPRKFIKQEEEILPIELSRNITAESVRHLAQHTNFISKVEGDTVTPSKILNVYKEESLETYENKFLNTLIDRLYIFVHKRYAKLREHARDEAVASLTYAAQMDTPSGGEVTMRMEIQTRDKTAGAEDSLWQRVEKLREVVDAYKGSSFVQSMNGQYIRPPVQRTNAILKDTDLKQCLMLWQYIESYDKVGYQVTENEAILKPDDGYIGGLYELAALQYLLFRQQTAAEEQPEAFKSRQRRPVSPKFVKSFERQKADAYNIRDTEFMKKLEYDPLHNRGKLSDDELRIRRAISAALAAEKKRKADEEARKRELERQRLEQERLAEERRLAEQRLAEEKRQAAVRLEEERRLAREREAQEKARRAEERRLAAEERAREQERRRAERERLAEEKAKREQEAALARLNARMEEQAKQTEDAAGKLLEQRRARLESRRGDHRGPASRWKNGR